MSLLKQKYFQFNEDVIFYKELQLHAPSKPPKLGLTSYKSGNKICDSLNLSNEYWDTSS